MMNRIAGSADVCVASHALDSGEPTRGGVRVAHANLQLIFGMIESHRRGGVRVDLPLRESPLRLRRRNVRPGRPRYSPQTQ